MKDVRSLRSERVAVYPPGSIPITKIAAGQLGKAIHEALAFGSVAGTEDGGIQFNHGRIEAEEHEIIVFSAKLEERRVIIRVEGGSADADFASATIERLLFKEEDSPSAKVVVYDTGCTAVLGFDWDELIGGPLAELVGGPISLQLANGRHEARVASATIAIQLAFETPPDLAEWGIALSPKLFTIGSASGFPLSERRFSSSSPTRSEQHLALLEQLEAAVLRAEGQ